MDFYPNQIFHIYNQGNNGRNIFFEDKDYLFFIWKMRGILPPFGDLISYCLMPNHFHFQFYVKVTEITRSELRESVDSTESLRRIKTYKNKAKPIQHSSNRSADSNALISLNNALGLLERSYARTINKEHGWTGSLFRPHCHAKDGWDEDIITLKKGNGKMDKRFTSENDYGYLCMNYIHNNPVEANMVSAKEDWEFSSARDYANLRSGTLCNLNLGRSLLNFM